MTAIAWQAPHELVLQLDMRPDAAVHRAAILADAAMFGHHLVPGNLIERMDMTDWHCSLGLQVFTGPNIYGCEAAGLFDEVRIQ